MFKVEKIIKPACDRGFDKGSGRSGVQFGLYYADGGLAKSKLVLLQTEFIILPQCSRCRLGVPLSPKKVIPFFIAIELDNTESCYLLIAIIGNFEKKPRSVKQRFGE